MRASLHSSRWLSGTVREVILEPQERFTYRPGQYIGIARPGGPGRCYSMARAPSSDNRIALHVQRQPGGKFSDLAMREVRVGDEFEITGPHGAFAFPDGDGPVVMLATGTGVAPFLAMLEAILPAAPGRRVSLYWGLREERDLYAKKTFDDWQRRFRAFRFVPVFSALGAERVQQVAVDSMPDPGSTHLLACGNPRMIDEAYDRFVAGAAVPVASFASDAFEAAADGDAAMAGRAATLAVPPARSASPVTLFVNGKPTPAVPGASVLAALKTARLPVMSVCGGKASCGTCLVEIEPAWVDRLAPRSKTERNLLACLPDTGPFTRLSCQLRVTPDTEGLAIRISSLTTATKESP